MSDERTHEYFLEVLAEEIPAWMLPPPALHREMQTVLAKLGIENSDDSTITIGATPRRIWIHLSGLPEKQADRDEEVKGPPRKIAFAADGSPAAALTGFLKKNDAAISDIVSAAGDDYVRIRRTVTGRRTTEVLSETLPRLLEGLRWPKMMRWGDGSRSWIRPVHSIVSIFDGESMPVEIFGIRSGTSTHGHRILAPETIPIASFADYVHKMGAAHVVVEAAERERMMKQRARGLAEQVGGEPALDETIWKQWRYLTEFPGVIRAEFDESLLDLPNEVLITVMRVHQKQLPVVKGTTLTNSFLAVMDQVDDPDGNIASGNAFVTNARFADARFFYETDRKRRLADRVPELVHLQFQEKLGNYRDKTERIVAVAASLVDAAALTASREQVLTAARLCKADLMTEMVKEFTELQGRIGGIYAREEGLSEEIWTAIYDHYLPVGAEDELPRTETGAIVSLADRIDTLAGFFLIGLKPTGSRDPFALRRAAQGVVQILANRSGWQIPLSVEQLVDSGLAVHQPDGAALQQARAELLDFFAERVKNLFESAPFSFAYDEVASAMAAGWANSLTDLHDRIVALRSVRNAPDFLSLLDSARRIANITAGHPSVGFRRELLQDPAEMRLADLADLVGSQIDELAAQHQYQVALESFAGMASELENFFQKVMVMVEDISLRENRMALLRRVGNAVGTIADVTRIVVDRSEYTREA